MQSDRTDLGIREHEARLLDRIRDLEHSAAQRRRSREALQLREARLVEAQRIARLGNWEWDVARDEVFWSDEMYRLFGLSREDFEATYEGFLDRVHEEDRPSIRAQIEATFRNDVPYVVDFRVIRADGSVRNLRGEGWVERDTDGQPVRLIGTCQDITERRRSEEQRLQLLDQLQRARRLEGLAMLADELANDFEELFGEIQHRAEALRTVVPQSGIALHHLDGITHTLTRSRRLTDQIRACSGTSLAEWDPIDLNAVVQDSAEEINSELASDVNVTYALRDGLPRIRGHEDRIRQIIAALVNNAAESMVRPNGAIAISTGVMHIDSTHLAGAYLADDLPEGMYAYLRVADNGCGLDEEAREHIFEPFYSQKGPHRGLGLAWVAGAVRSYRGAILVNSEVDRGSTFTVLLPAAPVGYEVLDESESLGVPGSVRCGSIVVVDDESAVRSVVKLLLERRGFDVLLARGGEEGLEVVASHDGDVRAVVLDMNMPRMSGEEVLGQLRHGYRDLPVVVMTGTSDPDVLQRLRQDPNVRVVQKPFRAAALLEQLASLLSRPELEKVS